MEAAKQLSPLVLVAADRQALQLYQTVVVGAISHSIVARILIRLLLSLAVAAANAPQEGAQHSLKLSCYVSRPRLPLLRSSMHKCSPEILKCLAYD